VNENDIPFIQSSSLPGGVIAADERRQKEKKEQPAWLLDSENMEMEPDIENMTGKKDFDFDKILDDLFRIGVENMKRMGHGIVHDSIWEHNDDLEEDQEEDGDDGDIFYMWDITKPHSHHTTYDDYVAPATKSILDKLLQEFKDEILNVTMVDDEADFNPTKDLEELERLLAKEPQSNFTEI
ncbi:hypothetical protein Tco_0473995, partial [Tanacetum coccineum]